MNRPAVAMVTVLGSLAAATSATADVEVGGTAGVHAFAADNALGTKKNDVISHNNSALFGLRFSYLFSKMLGVEVEGGAIPTQSGDDNVTFDVWMATARVNAIAQFRAQDPSNTIIPFATLGGGLLRIIDIGTNDGSLMRKDTDGQVFAGGGVKYKAGNGWGVRFDARLVLAPSNQDKLLTTDGELLLSLYRDFAQKAAPKVAAVKKDDDPDKDAIVGAQDQCPDDAEDKDGFEDENGCPDPDNDADTLLDGADKCPTEPEDKDSFEDEDGCPDLDNDKDDVPDSGDKCGDQPETKNGFEDEDGCPDEIPAKLTEIVGPIQGVGFKPATAELLPAASKALDKVSGVLGEVAGVRVEIQGHTDDVAPKDTKAFADNDALSQARADAVKAYLVKKGVAEDRIVAKGYGASAPVVDPTGLDAAKLAKARAQNARIELKLGGAAPKADAPKADAPKN